MSAQTLVKKKFVLYYSPEFAGGERVTLETMDFFTDENGFRPFEIREVFELEKDEQLHAGPLRVWRVV